MKQRGRRSTDALATAALTVAKVERIRAPEGLTYEQRIVFAEIVENLAADFFTQEQAPLIGLLARHLVTADRLSAWANRLESPGDGEVFDEKTYLRVLDARRKETAAIKLLATALRLTSQSRWRPAQAGERAGSQAPKPWES